MEWDSPFATPATSGPVVQPRMIDEYGAVGGMRIDRGNRSTGWKHSPVLLWPPHDLTWGRTCAAAVGSQRLIAWSTGVPEKLFLLHLSVRCTTDCFFNSRFQKVRWLYREVTRKMVVIFVVFKFPARRSLPGHRRMFISPSLSIS
jgi:hypothetical protein